jgi:hypothetical protein
MIVVVDTNALRGDLYLRRSQILSLFAAAEAGRLEVRIPSVVIEELVRQFPGRLAEISGALSGVRRDVEAMGLELPRQPDRDQEVAGYRETLNGALAKEGVTIAGPPADAGRIAEWVAMRREPIPGDGSGTVDAQIWLTAVEAAGEDEEVVLISNNHDDFAASEDKTVLHAVLKGDLRERHLDDESVQLLPRIVDFLNLHIEPDEEATGKAEALLANPQRRGDLVREIEGAVDWFPLNAEDQEWDTVLKAEIDEATLAAFDISGLRLIRAEAGPRGTYMTIEAYGDANLDIGMFKYEASSLRPDSPIEVDEWDWNESMSQAHATVPARLRLEILLDQTGFGISVDEVEPVDVEDVLGVLSHWHRDHGTDVKDLVAEEFDADGQEATTAWPRQVDKFVFAADGLYARVEFGVEYDNPIDDEDSAMSASNVSEIWIDVKVVAPDFDRLECEGVFWEPNAFPN